MGQLSNDDKEKIKRALPKTSNKIIDVAVARLYIAYPDPNEWRYTGLSGALVLVDDLVGCTFFLKLVDIDGHRGVLWDQELYVGFEYNQDRTFFHSFELEQCYAGLLFEDLGEAAHMLKRVQKREKYASKKTLSNKNAIALSKKLEEEHRASRSTFGPRGEPIITDQRRRYSYSTRNYEEAPPVVTNKKKAPPPPPEVEVPVPDIKTHQKMTMGGVPSSVIPEAPSLPSIPRSTHNENSIGPNTRDVVQLNSQEVKPIPTQRRSKYEIPPPPAEFFPMQLPPSPEAFPPRQDAPPGPPQLPGRNSQAPRVIDNVSKTQQQSHPPPPPPPAPSAQTNSYNSSIVRPVPPLPTNASRNDGPPVPPSRRNPAPPPPPRRNVATSLRNSGSGAQVSHLPSVRSPNSGGTAPPPPPRRSAAPPPPPRTSRLADKPGSRQRMPPPSVVNETHAQPPAHIQQFSPTKSPSQQQFAQTKAPPQQQERPGFPTPPPPPPPPPPALAVTSNSENNGSLNESTGDPGRDALLASIRGARGVNGLRKVDKSALDRPSVILQEARGEKLSNPSSNAALSSTSTGGQASLADALAEALNMRKSKVRIGLDDHNNDDW
ncbi:HHR115Wp [Eremothecium sinecaudum]|uniref:HHR115Wp n=1 Tax=Eremothecium sinecaudum TaxID=45286 RepID=A0A0X8HWT1_9SACH|nr:HHR115Wp [Eremothecium sinecaudum]AMD22884.1 HHR115Wp [Eremothecium sinecaudum]